MKFTTAAAGAAALFGSFASAAPAELQARVPSTSAVFSAWTVSCGASSCSYTAAFRLYPDNVPVTCNRTTTGATVPATSSFYTCDVTNVALRFNRLPSPVNAYRILITDARTVGTSTDLDYFSPLTDWPNNTAYTGPTNFTAN
ncbi:hypothetical protein QBC35DRAFT_528091 [Podospora australis]|uniref:Uncharacterized protein n=1 Tax=Podospora australis TaxID=1536484 RepID=A0AAN6X356_9PEZI|nr:hypothetical protein QBC35DRAFT_528091 [Podospora australis]